MRFCPSWYQSAELPQETKIIQNPRLPFTQALVTVTGDRRQQIVDHPAPVGLDLGCQRHAGAERHMHAIDVDPVAVQSNPDRLDQAGFLVSHGRSEEHTSELQSLMRTEYAVLCLKKKQYNTL